MKKRMFRYIFSGIVVFFTVNTLKAQKIAPSSLDSCSKNNEYYSCDTAKTDNVDSVYLKFGRTKKREIKQTRINFHRKLQDSAVREHIKTLNNAAKDAPKFIFEIHKKIETAELDTAPTSRKAKDFDIDLDSLDNIKSCKWSALSEKINCTVEAGTGISGMNIRNSPNVISVVSEEDIKNSGARDLIDVLNLVPGIYFALDQRGNIGIGIRGQWAGDGKVLMLIDGQEVNDIYSAKLYFGNHFPVQFIKRIEIIRGPGTAIYGGFAELGVINIVTKIDEENNRISFGVINGNAGTNVQRSYSLFAKYKFTKFTFAGWIHWGDGQRSDKKYFSRYVDERHNSFLRSGKYVSLQDESNVTPSVFQFSFQYKNWNLKILNDNYSVTDITKIDTNDKHPIKSGFRINCTELKYDWKISSSFKLTPRLSVVNQVTEITGRPGIVAYDKNTLLPQKIYTPPDQYDNFVIRPKLSVIGEYEYSVRANCLFGAEFYDDYFRRLNIDSLHGKSEISYQNLSLFGQMVLKTPFANFIGGVRYDKNSSYGEKVSPRLCLTKKFEYFHYKLLMNKAFRAPAVAHILNSFDGENYVVDLQNQKVTLNRGIKAESTRYLEIEVGYQITSDILLTANFFDITTQNPIAFYFYKNTDIENIYADTYEAPNGAYVYGNFESSGSRGVEFEVQFKTRIGYIRKSYSFYSVASKSKIPVQSVRTFDYDFNNQEEVNSSAVLALPQHKIVIDGVFYIKPDFTVSMSYLYFSQKYGYDVDVNPNNPLEVSNRLITKNSVFVTNLFFRWKRLLLTGLDFSFGVHNLFNADVDYLQPYFGLDASLSAVSREWTIKLSYDINFKSERKEKQHDD